MVWMTRWLWLAAVPIAIAAIYFALLFVAQRSMLFPMPAQVPSGPPPGAEEVKVEYDDGEAYALYLAPREPRGAAPLLIFMHGNGELADY